MNYNCWQNEKVRIVNDDNDEDETEWPKLLRSAIQEKSSTRNIVRSRFSRVDLAGPSIEIDVINNINEIDYPKLGETLFKKKYSFVERDGTTVLENYVDREERRLQVPKSTDLIHVNLQQTLERQSWPIPLPANHRSKRIIDICKLNVNMSVASPLARWLLTKSKRRAMHIEKKKRPSRLKGLILYERMIRKQPSSNENRILEISSNSREEVAIHFKNLRINVAPQEDTELLKKMSSLACLNANYRDTREIVIDEDDLIFQPDLQEKMENMSISDSKLVNCEDNELSPCIMESIDPETMKATQSLKICDETEEFIDNVFIKEETNERIKFTKKFREYCTNIVTSNLRTYLEDFLTDVSRLQKKKYEKDSVKGRSKRRYYAGIKEIQKHVDLKKIKFVIIATDLEKVEIKGGLDDTLSKLVGTCKRCEVPYCFGLGRRKLGYYIHGKGFVSCIGIANYSGVEEKLKNVLLEVVKARNDFSLLMSDDAKIIDVEKLLPNEELLLSEIVSAYLRILASTN